MQSILRYTILPKVLTPPSNERFDNFSFDYPAEHLWCDFKWAKTNDLYIHYMDKSNLPNTG